RAASVRRPGPPLAGSRPSPLVAEHPDDVLLEAMALGAVRDGPPRTRDAVAVGAPRELPERLAEPDEPRDHHRVADQRSARRVDRRARARRIEPHRLAEDQLLGGRRRAEVDDVDGGPPPAAPPPARAPRRGVSAPAARGSPAPPRPGARGPG